MCLQALHTDLCLHFSAVGFITFYEIQSQQLVLKFHQFVFTKLFFRMCFTNFETGEECLLKMIMEHIHVFVVAVVRYFFPSL